MCGFRVAALRGPQPGGDCRDSGTGYRHGEDASLSDDDETQVGVARLVFWGKAMSGKHWTDDELLEHLYGLRSGNKHMESCGECTARARMISETRDAVTEPPDVSHELLEAQRRSIYQRLGSPVRVWHPLR